MGLDEKFRVIKAQILAMKPTPQLSTVYRLLAKDEQQRTIVSSKRLVHEAAAFQASFQGRREQMRNQQEKGWMKINKGPQVDKTIDCSHCERYRHDRDGCFKRIGYLE